MALTLAEQACSNCRYSRRPAGFGDDGRLSCRYLPPQPCDNNIWRLVPDTFWCGRWEWGPQDPIPGRKAVSREQLQSLLERLPEQKGQVKMRRAAEAG